METDEIMEKLVTAFLNRTKLAIITLLIHRRRLTVTQMSRYLSTTRSNLYQTISDLLESGIILGLESVVRKNYVEKYYTLNEAMFSVLDTEKWKERLKLMNPSQGKSLISSFLLAQSLRLQIMASEVEMVDDGAARAIGDLLESGRIMLSYGRVSDRTYGRLVDMYGKIESMLKESADEDGNNTFAIIGMPSILSGSAVD